MLHDSVHYTINVPWGYLPYYQWIKLCLKFENTRQVMVDFPQREQSAGWRLTERPCWCRVNLWSDHPKTWCNKVKRSPTLYFYLAWFYMASVNFSCLFVLTCWACTDLPSSDLSLCCLGCWCKFSVMEYSDFKSLHSSSLYSKSLTESKTFLCSRSLLGFFFATSSASLCFSLPCLSLGHSARWKAVTEETDLKACKRASGSYPFVVI